MLSTMAGPDGVAQPGDRIEVSEEEGKALIAGKYALRLVIPTKPVLEEVVEEEVAETAAPDSNETTDENDEAKKKTGKGK